MAKNKRDDSWKQFPGQHPDEEIKLVFNQHPVVMRHALIYGMLAILVGIIPLLMFPLSDIALQIMIVVPLLVFVYWFYHWMNWHYSVYIVTDRRLIDIQQKGFWNRRVNEIAFSKVQSINYHINGFQAVIFKFGDITIKTYTDEVELPMVHRPEEVHSEIMDAARQVTSTLPSN